MLFVKQVQTLLVFRRLPKKLYIMKPWTFMRHQNCCARQLYSFLRLRRLNNRRRKRQGISYLDVLW